MVTNSARGVDRRVGFVFQKLPLFSSYDGFADNVAFWAGKSCLVQNAPSVSKYKSVSCIYDMVQLAHLANRFPSQLLVVQKQRIGLGKSFGKHNQKVPVTRMKPFGAFRRKSPAKN